MIILDMIDMGAIEKRFEILVGHRLHDSTSAKDAAEVQDRLRRKSRSFVKGKSSVELLREWRDGRWSS
ncbi:MAG: hypothetical protein V3T58_02720 [Candidatus Hydrothermarchaeales archaeon]